MFDFVSYSKKIQFAPQLAPNEEFEFDPNRSIKEQAAELPYNLTWEFPRSDVRLVRLIGMGCFGQVWEAESEGQYTIYRIYPNFIPKPSPRGNTKSMSLAGGGTGSDAFQFARNSHQVGM